MPSKTTDLVLTTLQLRSPSRGTTLPPRERSLPTLPLECRLDDLASNERCRRRNLEQNPPSSGVLADPQGRRYSLLDVCKIPRALCSRSAIRSPSVAMRPTLQPNLDVKGVLRDRDVPGGLCLQCDVNLRSASVPRPPAPRAFSVLPSGNCCALETSSCALNTILRALSKNCSHDFTRTSIGGICAC